MEIHLASASGFNHLPKPVRVEQARTRVQRTNHQQATQQADATASNDSSKPTVTTQHWPASSPKPIEISAQGRSPFALLMVVLAHILLLIGFLTVRQHVKAPVTPPQPLVISIIPEQVEKPAPEIAPVPPKTLNIAPPQPQIPPPALLLAETPIVTPSPIAASATSARETSAVAPSVTNNTANNAPPTPAVPASAPSAPIYNADYLNNPAPKYPALSRRAGEEGTVMLRVFVDAAGAPTQVNINTSSGFERLDKAAVNAVRQWKFVAARQAGEAIGAWVLVPIIFNIKS